MKQNINLYGALKPETQVKATFWSWARFWLFTFIIIIVFLIMYLLQVWEVHQLNNERLSLLTQLGQLEKQFYEAKQKYPPLFFTENASASVDTLKKNVVAENELLKAMANEKHFSDFLTALTRTITSNTWLINIAISKNGEQILLKGKSLDMTDIHQFLKNIATDKSFKDANATLSNVENLSKIKEDLNNLAFEITIIKKST